MKKIIAIIALAFVGQAQAQPMHIEIAKSQASDTCYYKEECAYMWSKAQSSIEQITSMHIRMQTDDRIETYPDFKHGNLVGTVTKIPADDGGNRITATIETSYSDDHGAADGMQHNFAQMMQEAKWRYALRLDGLALQAKGYNVEVPEL